MTAGINTVTALVPDALVSVRSFQLGSLAGVTWKGLAFGGAAIVPLLAALIFTAGELDILSLGSETAYNLGLNVKLYRFIFLAASGALAGAAVSFGGLIGFVGLIVPHFTRMVGLSSTSRQHIVMSAISGGAFLTLCDTIARTLPRPFELPVGVFTAFVGAPFFLLIVLRRSRGYANADTGFGRIRRRH
jgi:iron complex transport system permease protein